MRPEELAGVPRTFGDDGQKECVVFVRGDDDVIRPYRHSTARDFMIIVGDHGYFHCGTHQGAWLYSRG